MDKTTKPDERNAPRASAVSAEQLDGVAGGHK
jgi:hypothetical protein